MIGNAELFSEWMISWLDGIHESERLCGIVL
jgi:hypothetical protein